MLIAHVLIVHVPMHVPPMYPCAHVPMRKCRSQPHLALGSTVLRRRLLEGLGWRVVPVAGHAWSALRSEEDQIMFILGELNSRGVEL